MEVRPEGATRRAVIAATGEPLVIGDSEKMSKSKRNVVAPAAIADLYGIDAARLFVLSDSPPDRDVQWTSAGVEGRLAADQPDLGRVRRQPAGRERGSTATGRPAPPSCVARPIGRSRR